MKSLLLCVACIACGETKATAPDAAKAIDARATDAADDDAAVASLAGLRWEIACTSPFNQGNCNATDPAPITATLGGSSGVTYQVALRFRGVVEAKTYDGGTTTGSFNAGGTAANDGFNVYGLAVSAPAQTYYLNAGTSGIGTSAAIDYAATVPMAAGATVTLTATTVDGVEHTNGDGNGTPIVVPDIPPAPDAYDGQFVQMDVTSVTH